LQTPALLTLLRRLESGGTVSQSGIPRAAQPYLAALLRELLPTRPLVVVTDGLKAQESFQQDWDTWQAAGRKAESGNCGLQKGAPSVASAALQPSGSGLLFYPAWEILPHEGRLPHADVISERLETLVELGNTPCRATPAPDIVTSVVALLQKTFPPETLRNRTRQLQRGDRMDPLDLVEWLELQGYEPEAQVTQKGDLALRGGILDVFPLTSAWPVRLEFFGDELESLRHFDPATQISRESIPSVTLPPAGDLGLFRKPQADNSSEAPTRLTTLLEYLPPETIFLLSNPAQLEWHAEAYKNQIPPGDPLFTTWAAIKAELTARGMTVLEVGDDEPAAPGPEDVDTPQAGMKSEELFCSLESFRPLTGRAPEPAVAEAQRREFFAQLHRWLRQGCRVHVFCNNDGERQRFIEVWAEHGLTPSIPQITEAGASNPLAPEPHLGSLSRGFLCEQARLVVVTDAEIFGRYKVQRPRRLKSPHAQAARSVLDIDFTELEEGDLVVHIQHGIGRYLGLKRLPSAPRPARSPVPDPAVQPPEELGAECLVIEYAASDPALERPKLYVPVTEAHLVGKYVGAGKATPPLNTLGGTRWIKAKEQAERAVRDVAAELLTIQAARESQPGHACSADVPWQREFEGSFLFEETPDQLRAINETKADMERAKPMDRLICGDVGFGKTEVAIRAAFKAVMDGRQVAILVPTTVLAQQHYNNFRERMADYPIRIELLSRFRTRRELQRVVRDLPAGAVDIVIGTHRLVQSDIAFKDLGLVVIDEEQRFGVLHKEKFKRLRKLVDVLTLSATPIPRTLYLALTGARDMSTIQTPPHDRLPVETIVTQYDERVIRDAIRRELNRGGQVFFLHNRVMTIHAMYQKLQSLVPDARILVGHGQLGSDELEDVMTKFVNGEADVLLSTTIIESGLDIPNANTIIIDRADRFGLSELYQLRGRVGRYKHQAYAYLLLPRHARLLTDARKRIGALKQYSTLGSGFKIAMRDLEIRGAGNLLGSEQSGHITAVGFDLYCQLLKQSVAGLKGEKLPPRVEVRVALDFLPEAGKLPETYAPESQHRVEIYRKLAQATDRTSLDSLHSELRDRFGPPPPAVELLLQTAELKILASERAVGTIEVKEDKLMLTRRGDLVMVGGKFPRLTKKAPPARLKEIKRLLLAL